MSGEKIESLTETLTKQAEARFSASAATEREERHWFVILFIPLFLRISLDLRINSPRKRCPPN